MKNLLRERLNNGRKLCGMHISLTDPLVSALIGRMGYDFVWVDAEHSVMEPRGTRGFGPLHAIGCGNDDARGNLDRLRRVQEGK